MDVLAVILAGTALVISIVVAIRNWNAPKHSSEANSIAGQALDMARTRQAREDSVIVQPERYGNEGVTFMVIANGPVPEVRFEFADYAGFNRSTIRLNVTNGQLTITRNEFDEAGGLGQPPGRHWYARTSWRENGGTWNAGPIFDASKGNRVFQPLEQNGIATVDDKK